MVCIGHDPVLVYGFTAVDLVTGAAYLVIPAMVAVLWHHHDKRRPDSNGRDFTRMVAAFAFILACGIYHFSRVRTIYDASVYYQTLSIGIAMALISTAAAAYYVYLAFPVLRFRYMKLVTMVARAWNRR